MPEALARSKDLFGSHDWEEMDAHAMRLDAMLEAGSLTFRTATSPDDMRDEWLHLQENGHGTLFTSYEWLSAWYDLVGRPRGIDALIILGELDGEPAFLLPLGICRHGHRFLSVGRFLGDFHGNQNSGLWRKDVFAGIHGHTIRTALRKVGRARGIDLFDLKYVPAHMDNRIHPLIDQTAMESLNCVHTFALRPDFETLYRDHRSASARKKLRAKERKLKARGHVTYERARDPQTAGRFLDALVAQRSARQESHGIPNVFHCPDVQAFLRQQLTSSIEANCPHTLIYALNVGGNVRATYLCGLRFGRYHAYTNSIDESIAAYSPGDLLLNRVIEDACAMGAHVFDFGLGAERYKTAWASKEMLMDVDIPVSPTGYGARRGIQALRRTKRAIRNTPALWAMIRWIRRLKAAGSAT